MAARDFAKWLELRRRHAVLFNFNADAATEALKLLGRWEPESGDVVEYM